MASPSPSETWHEITALVDRIADLARSNVPVERFHHELLRQVVQGTDSLLGAVWEPQPDRSLLLAHQVRSSGGSVDPSHTREHVEAFFRGLSEVPSEQTHDRSVRQEAGCIILLEPIRADRETMAVVELFLAAHQADEVQQGIRQLLSVVCELAGDYHRNRLLRRLQHRDRVATRLELFVRKLIERVDLDHVAYTVSNEGRTIIECDRLSVLTYDGKNCRLCSTSGVDTIDRRSASVALMQQVACLAAVQDSEIWYPAGAARGETDSAPLLDEHLSQSQAVGLGLVPLANRAEAVPQPCGVLLIECFDSPPSSTEWLELRERARRVANVSSGAMQNAFQFGQLPLLNVSRKLLQAKLFLRRWQGLATCLVLAALVGLLWIPVEFHVAARGTLEPELREVIYAPSDGIVTAFPALVDPQHSFAAADGLEISAGDVILELRNSTLDYQLAELLGEQTTIEQRLDTIRVTLEALGRSSSPAERSRFDEMITQRLEHEAALRSLAEQINVLRDEKASLSIKARMGGQVLTWDVIDELQSRPVRQGERLLTIVKTDGPWRLDVHVPDQHIGYIVRAQREIDEQLPVSFLLRAAPEKVFHGRVRWVAMATEAHEEHGASVRVEVELEPGQQLGHPRPGTTVAARIQCGRAALWYVRLHDLIEAVRTRFLFW